MCNRFNSCESDVAFLKAMSGQFEVVNLSKASRFLGCLNSIPLIREPILVYDRAEKKLAHPLLSSWGELGIKDVLDGR